MNELAMQALIVDAVNGAGGFAYKMSHRFLVGVVDVLVKLPGYPAGVLEVKQRDKPRDMELKWTLDVTGPQHRFLREAWNAGMPSGVASFMQVRGKGARGLWLGVWTYPSMQIDNWIAHASAHEPLHGKNSSTPEQNIVTLLNGWASSCVVKQGPYQRLK